MGCCFGRRVVQLSTRLIFVEFKSCQAQLGTYLPLPSKTLPALERYGVGRVEPEVIGAAKVITQAVIDDGFEAHQKYGEEEGVCLFYMAVAPTGLLPTCTSSFLELRSSFWRGHPKGILSSYKPVRLACLPKSLLLTWRARVESF